jgi:hypothetical protein
MNLQEQFARITESIGGFLAVDQNRVNIEDLIFSLDNPGRLGIVRVEGDPNGIKFFPLPGQDMTGCIAGWISEGE